MGSGFSAHRSPFKRPSSGMVDETMASKATKSLETVPESKSTSVKPKEPPAKPGIKVIKVMKEQQAKPSKSQLEKWTSSINSLLSDPDGVLEFEKFLGEAESEPDELKRYLYFYRDCGDFKSKICYLEKEARRIFETYLEVGSDLEVGTGKKGEEVGTKLDEVGFPHTTLFDEAQQKVKENLDNIHYINFCLHLKEKYKL